MVILHACRWVPVQERSRSLALVYSGMYTGSILGLALSPHMIEVRAVHASGKLLIPCLQEAAHDVILQGRAKEVQGSVTVFLPAGVPACHPAVAGFHGKRMGLAW